jgi:hypothetical protein
MSPGLADVPYASKTAPRADPRHKQNQQTDHGVRCWFAPEDVQGDKKLHEQIDEAVHLYDKLLLILSDASIAASSWVQRGDPPSSPTGSTGGTTHALPDPASELCGASGVGVLVM